MSDLFSSLFDLGKKGPSGSSRPGQSGRNPRSQRRKGAHVEYVVEISFVTAARGGKIALDIPISEDCATCAGDGAKLGTEAKHCGECSGSGTISFGQGGFAVKRPCPACFGRGILPETPCASCSGRGTVRQQRKMSLNVRSGVDTGSKVRLHVLAQKPLRRVAVQREHLALTVGSSDGDQRQHVREHHVEVLLDIDTAAHLRARLASRMDRRRVRVHDPALLRRRVFIRHRVVRRSHRRLLPS